MMSRREKTIITSLIISCGLLFLGLTMLFASFFTEAWQAAVYLFVSALISAIIYIKLAQYLLKDYIEKFNSEGEE